MKNRYFKWHLPVMFLLALAGCSLAPPRPVAISLPPQPIIKDSFSLLPLNEGGWLVVGQGSDVLSLGTRGAVPGETRIVNGFVRPLPTDMTDAGFLAFAKSVKKMEPPKRYELLKQEAQEDNSTAKNCAKVRATLKDLAPNVFTKRTDPMIIDSLYWVCKHPDGKSAVIIEYSHRLYAGNEEKTFEKNAETVFRGLEFVAR